MFLVCVSIVHVCLESIPSQRFGKMRNSTLCVFLFRLGFVLHGCCTPHNHGHGRFGHAHHHHPVSTHGGGAKPDDPDVEVGSLAPRTTTNINVRAAFIHVLGDLVQSIGVLIAAFIIRYKVSLRTDEERNFGRTSFRFDHLD